MAKAICVSMAFRSGGHRNLDSHIRPIWWLMLSERAKPARLQHRHVDGVVAFAPPASEVGLTP
jgi:hypothetical protein